MPSPLSPRRRPPRGKAARAASATFVFVALAALLLLVSACSTAPAPAPLPRQVAPHGVAEAERGYLLDPLEGYPTSATSAKSAAVSERRERIARVERTLVEEADPAAIEAARSLARDLGSGAAGDPDFPPAKVLAAEADFVAGDRKGIVARLLPVGDALPTYTASQMLLGRTAELAGDLPLAYSAYRAVAAKNSLALRRTGELHPRVIEIVGIRLHEALKADKLDEAGRQLTLLFAWAPTETATYEATRAVAVARGDRRAELGAIKNLSQRRPGDRDLLERRSDLELQVGDPAAGLKIIQGLADQNPKDEGIATRLASAKFLWRLSLLPAKVRDIAEKEDLTRADLAVLLYWLIPEVRYGKPSEGRIATDVLDHPQREEIVRVVNLGLLDVDDTLHHFSPGSPVRRGTALRSVLRLLSRFATPPPPCLGDPRVLCDAARRCDLVPEGEDCQSNDPFSGEDAVELLRRALALLGRA